MWITRDIDAPAEQAWDLLVDVRRWPVWGPSVRRAEVDPRSPSAEGDDAHRIAAGSTGRVRPVVGPWIPFRITGFDEGRSWAWEVAGVRATGHRVEELGPGRCRVGFQVPTWAAPYATVCALALRRIERALGS